MVMDDQYAVRRRSKRAALRSFTNFHEATMHCPFCSASDTKVIDSRLVAEGQQVRRRRECVSCHERFTTFEEAELLMPRLVKNDGTRQPFDEAKLRAGIQRALEKRPVGVEDIEACINRVKQRLRATGEREIPSVMVGEAAMAELRRLDQVAYVRFASVYRSFQDINEFRLEIDRLAEAESQPESASTAVAKPQRKRSRAKGPESPDLFAEESE